LAFDDRLLERKLLLKRTFPRIELFEIGKELNIPYFDRCDSGWDINDDDASLEIASKISDTQLKKVFDEHSPRKWTVFRGTHYTFENGELRLEGSDKTIRANVYQAQKKYGKNCVAILKTLVEAGRSCSLNEIKKGLRRGVDPLPILAELEELKIITTSYKSGQYQEWKIPEEVSPMVQAELGIVMPVPPKMGVTPTVGMAEADYMLEERQRLGNMDKELGQYLNDLLKHRLGATIKFGKTFSVTSLASYLLDLFGPILYFDSLLSITQQYGLADVEITHEHGKTGMRTGWNLSLFGEPGTGKSFSVRDMILGKPDAKIFPHGIPGRNRYAGGMTPARFIRIGQAYVKRTFNFIIPEFNDWFKYKGMVEPLKLAMERGEIKYEMHREVIGPYRFGSYFSVNYNVSIYDRGYEVTVRDPNFNAIEDRMLCRLHRLTKQRYVEIAESQMRLAFGKIDIKKGSQQIRDHLTLIYAIETGNPLVKGQFPYKPMMITPQAYDLMEKAREAILELIPHEFVRFSARLENRAIRFACAASLLNYFRSDLDYIPVSEDALRYAMQLYVEEASVRSREEFKPREVLEKLA
jgi:hypothetical protein